MNQASFADTPHDGKLLAYAQLIRLPNCFTAIADVMMGYLFVHASLTPLLSFASLLVSSCLLYSAGMVLNDVNDFKVDSEQRPERPIPSGRIALDHARLLGYGMLVGGIILGGAAGLVLEDENVLSWRSGAVAVLLAACIVLYDGPLKATAIGPVLMGACRMLNILLGMSTAVIGEGSAGLLGYDLAQLIVAAGIGVFIMGVTLFASSEARQSDRRLLVMGTVVIVFGLTILSRFPRFGQFAAGEAELTVDSPIVWPALVFLLGFSIVRRCIAAIRNPQPSQVQLTVKQCIMSLIVLDASVCLVVRSPVWWAVAIVALIVPMLILGRRIYST